MVIWRYSYCCLNTTKPPDTRWQHVHRFLSVSMVTWSSRWGRWRRRRWSGWPPRPWWGQERPAAGRRRRGRGTCLPPRARRGHTPLRPRWPDDYRLHCWTHLEQEVKDHPESPCRDNGTQSQTNNRHNLCFCSFLEWSLNGHLCSLNWVC